METIKEIVQRKKIDIDCTEEESAELKGFIKEYIVQIGNGSIELIQEIEILLQFKSVQDYLSDFNKKLAFITFLERRQFTELLPALYSAAFFFWISTRIPASSWTEKIWDKIKNTILDTLPLAALLQYLQVVKQHVAIKKEMVIEILTIVKEGT